MYNDTEDKKIEPMADFCLKVYFDDGRVVLYDVKEDMHDIPGYEVLRTTYGLFNQVQLDESLLSAEGSTAK